MATEAAPSEAPPKVTGLFKDLLEGSFPDLYPEPEPEPGPEPEEDEAEAKGRMRRRERPRRRRMRPMNPSRSPRG